ncbi:MAG: bifunctional glutamate N-acetyltransferase/amino-acid acetyltransferase ArgJ, partial [Chitinivibrionales bacterium]
TIHSLLCNSGNANSCTGKQGEEDTRTTAEIVASGLHIPSDQVLTASTGIIGKRLPVKKIQDSFDELKENLSDSGNRSFAEAIMTTDTTRKETSLSLTLSSGVCTVGGCAKGAGMIHPDMATMLAFITTDAKIQPDRLTTILTMAANNTFNNLTVDGDTSTNDMALLLANGASGVKAKTEEDYRLLYKGIESVCSSLCKAIAADGEGATKSIEIHVRGGDKREDCIRVAKAVAGSNLVKTAVFGCDPNWGRIISAAGYSKALFKVEDLCVYLCGVPVFKNGTPADFNQEALSHLMKENNEIPIDISIGDGEYTASAHTCDLTYDYIKINAEYHT